MEEGIYNPAYDWIHVPDADCWTGCDFCLSQNFPEDFEDEVSPLTWAVGEEVDLVVFADLQLNKEPLNFYVDIGNVSTMLLKLISAVRARNDNAGQEPCATALDYANPCSCCEGFKTSANVLWILGGEGNLGLLTEDIRSIRRFAADSLREALSQALSVSHPNLPWHVLDIMLDHMERSFNRGLYREEWSDSVQNDWSFVCYKEEDEEKLRLLYKELSNIYLAIINHLFVNPAKVPTTLVSDFTRIREGWTVMMTCIED